MAKEMNQLLERLLHTPPKLLAQFISAPADIALPEPFSAVPNRVEREIACTCGNDKLHLEAALFKEMKGVCRKQEIISYVPPVYVRCQACRRFTLLFDPLLHGWKGEMGADDNLDNDYQLIACSRNPGKVYVSYSYQRLERYEVLLEQGVANPEDYFDGFAVLFSEAGVGDLRLIVAAIEAF